MNMRKGKKQEKNIDFFSDSQIMREYLFKCYFHHVFRMRKKFDLFTLAILLLTFFVAKHWEWIEARRNSFDTAFCVPLKIPFCYVHIHTHMCWVSQYVTAINPSIDRNEWFLSRYENAIYDMVIIENCEDENNKRISKKTSKKCVL